MHGRDHPTRSFPDDLAEEVLARYGDDRTDRPGTTDWLCRLEILEEARLEAFLGHLLESVEQKTKLALELLAREDWDLFLLVFKEAHCAGHQCWHLVDPAHPAYSAALAERLADPLLRVYRALDRAIGRLRASLPPETRLLVFSDLDMGPNYTGEHILDDILRSLEGALWPGPAWPARWGRAAYALERRVARRWLGRAPRMALVRGHRRAFQLQHNEISGAIRLNLRGREPSGIVERGREAETVLSDLTHELLRLVNPATGGRWCRKCFAPTGSTRETIEELLPDLLVVWSREAPIASVRSPLLGRMRARSPRFRTGNHLGNGFCRVRPGRLPGVHHRPRPDRGPPARRPPRPCRGPPDPRALLLSGARLPFLGRRASACRRQGERPMRRPSGLRSHSSCTSS